MTTAVGFTDAQAAAVLNGFVRGTTIALPAGTYLGVMSAAHSDAGSGGTELTGNGYARKDVRSLFGTAATSGNTGISNDAAVDMATASGAWLAGVQVGLFAASSGGTPFALGAASLPALVTGQFHRFIIGALTFTLV
jgi:hypothetical protein